MEQPISPVDGFLRKFKIEDLKKKSVEKIQISLKSDKIDR
jgi:hypothetical protein